MRIVNLDTFLDMPGEVLFAKFGRSYFEELEIKSGNSGDVDFVTQQVLQVACSSSGEMYGILDEAEAGKPFSLDLDYAGRDGCFDRDQLFAVYEEGDLRQLIERLTIVLQSMEAPSE